MSFFSNLSQNVQVSAGNSSTANIGASATFTGTSQSTLGVAGIQVTLKADQNCMVYIDQSPDGSNWDIIDSYNYYASINNFGVTVQAVNSYVRVRVTNQSSTTATTYFRLQTCLCPIVESVPRSLDANGYLKTGIKSISDEYGFSVENTPMGELRVVNPIRLVGAQFDLNGNAGAVDSNFWNTSVSATATGESVAQSNGDVTLTSGTNAAAYARLYSVRRARYVGGTTLRYRSVMQLGDTGTANNIRRWGVAFGATMPTLTDGAWFQLLGTTFSIVTKRASAADTVVSSGSFNGTLGATYAPGITVATYEIYWTNSKVYFVIGGRLLHTVSASSETWAATVSPYVYMDNYNSALLGASTTLDCRTATIYRLGSLLTQPTSYYFANNTTAGTQLKYGAGNLHSITIQALNNSVITLSDSTSAATPVLWATTGAAAITQPVTIDFKGAPFFNGLRLTISAANAQIMVVYE